MDAATHLRIADLSGGKADNAIPREARAVLLLDDLGRMALERVAAEVQERVRVWRAGADNDPVIELVDHPTRPPVG